MAFLEGLFFVPEARRRGVAASLVAAVETWGRQKRRVKLAADALVGNRVSRAFMV